MKCLICHKNYKHLGSHLWHKHKVLAKDYKMEFGLPISLGLVSQEIRIKQQEANKRHYDKVVGQNLLTHTKHRFKAGIRTGKRPYISPLSMKKNIKQIVKFNRSLKLRPCPVCHLKTKHLASHLYNKHKLIQA